MTAAANTGPQRSGTVAIAGQTFTVTQAEGCVYTVTPDKQIVAYEGGAGTPFSVTTAPGCQWSAQSEASWITITAGATGSGSGSVAYSVALGTNKGRTGELTIAEKKVTVFQERK